MKVRHLRAALAALMLAFGCIGPAQAQDDSASVAGLYSGSQAEVGAMLELGEDGRYRYQLSYGALDEWSAGAWKKQDQAVVLQSDPFVAPAFEFSDQGGSKGELSVKMALPDGMDPQYFALTLHRKDGSASFESMSAAGLVLAMGDNPVISVRPALPVMDLLGPTFAVPEGGAALNILFKPNDLGFVGFSGEVLPRNGEGVFELARHGIVLRFRKVHR